MDLISREAVKEQAKASYHVAESMEQLGNLYEDCINALPSAFEGMTNGEVIQALFPEVKVEILGFLVRCVFIEHEFTTLLTWWNAPYQKGGEDKE